MADTVSTLHTFNIYEDPTEVKLQNPSIVQNRVNSSKVTDSVQLLDTGTAQQLLNITTKTLRSLQKQDRFCGRKVHELQTGLEDQFYLNNENILKRKVIVNNLEVNIIVIPAPPVYTLLYEFHNCKGHQGSARMFNLLKYRLWWKGMRLDVKNHINKCITCSTNLPNTAHHPQLHLEIPKVPFACIAIDTIDKLLTTSSGNSYALTYIDLLTSYIIAVPIANKAAELVIEPYLSGILSRTGASMVCLSDNRAELKNSQMNTILKQLGIKHIFLNPYRPQGNSRIENVHNFLKRMFLSSTDAEWDKILPFACYCFNTTPTADDLESPYFLIHGRDPLDGHMGLLGKGDIRYLGNDKGLILFTEICKLWLAHAKALQENRQFKNR